MHETMAFEGYHLTLSDDDRNKLGFWFRGQPEYLRYRTLETVIDNYRTVAQIPGSLAEVAEEMANLEMKMDANLWRKLCEMGAIEP